MAGSLRKRGCLLGMDMRSLMISAILLLGLGLPGAYGVETTIMTGKPTGTYIRF